MGLCLFNATAIAARWAQRRYGLERVAILDWDVHHGNGAERIFWEDGSVLTISLHQQRLYPPNVSGWNDDRWLDTATYLARWDIAGRVARTGQLDPNKVQAPFDAAVSALSWAQGLRGSGGAAGVLGRRGEGPSTPASPTACCAGAHCAALASVVADGVRGQQVLERRACAVATSGGRVPASGLTSRAVLRD